MSAIGALQVVTLHTQVLTHGHQRGGIARGNIDIGHIPVGGFGAAETGAQEGDPSKTPPSPEFSDGWQLGQPDMVIEMPPGYTLPADGKDVYRNFVLPVQLDRDRFVRARQARRGLI